MAQMIPLLAKCSGGLRRITEGWNHQLTPQSLPCMWYEQAASVYVLALRLVCCQGGITPEISESDLRDQFYAYGEIKSIRMAPKSHCEHHACSAVLPSELDLFLQVAL